VVRGYFLRILHDEWVESVFWSYRYYTGLRRRLEGGTYVFFLKKTEAGDSIVGYGVVGETLPYERLTEAEKELCVNRGWNRCIVFEHMKRLRRPIPLKELPIDLGRGSGRLLHGRRVEGKDLQRLLEILEAEKP